tara:strand:- start:30425 stop:31723 length:1299 start_codon:yes stop_codon:yes gene_type:complete
MIIKDQPEIYVIDRIMGSYKTTNAKEQMKGYIQDEKKFIFVTPLITEIKSTLEDIGKRNIFTPILTFEFNGYYNLADYTDDENDDDENNIIFMFQNKDYTPKSLMEHFLLLLDKKVNIVVTHSLFLSLKSYNSDLFKDYILIVDEVLSVVNSFHVTTNDWKVIEKSKDLMEFDDSGLLIDYDNKYDGVFFKSLFDFIKKNELIFNQNNDLIAITPIQLFKPFNEVYILTYMFEHSLMAAYFKLHQFTYKLEHNKDFEIKKLALNKKLLNIYNLKKFNYPQQKVYKFSKSSFKKMKFLELNLLKKNTTNIFRSTFKTHSNTNAYTTFKDYQDKLSGKRYATNFLPINIRATNDYVNIKSIAYLANRYMSASVKQFFAGYQIKINEDLWSLGELIQLLWRGCIRKGEPMNVYIPSKRMRSLLIDWLNADFIELT